MSLFWFKIITATNNIDATTFCWCTHVARPCIGVMHRSIISASTIEVPLGSYPNWHQINRLLSTTTTTAGCDDGRVYKKQVASAQRVNKLMLSMFIKFILSIQSIHPSLYLFTHPPPFICHRLICSLILFSYYIAAARSNLFFVYVWGYTTLLSMLPFSYPLLYRFVHTPFYHYRWTIRPNPSARRLSCNDVHMSTLAHSIVLHLRTDTELTEQQPTNLFVLSFTVARRHKKQYVAGAHSRVQNFRLYMPRDDMFGFGSSRVNQLADVVRLSRMFFGSTLHECSEL